MSRDFERTDETMHGEHVVIGEGVKRRGSRLDYEESAMDREDMTPPRQGTDRDEGPFAAHGANDPLAQVRQGMKVIDAADDDIGMVDYVKMGDPQAQTTQGQVDDDGVSLFEAGARAFGAEYEPQVPEPIRSQLLRSGFFKVDGKGWFDTDRYISADLVAGVTGDTVRLKVNKEEVPES